MSEYQYYEFQTTDRRLSEREMHELRSYSTRAHITPTSFVNEFLRLGPDLIAVAATASLSTKSDAATSEKRRAWLASLRETHAGKRTFGARLLKVGL